MSKIKNKKYVNSVEISELIVFATLYLSFASFYISFLIFPYALWILYVIIYALLIIPIIIFSYFAGKKIAIHCQSTKKKPAKFMLTLVLLSTCLSVLIFAIMHGIPARTCYPPNCHELSIPGALLRAFVASAVFIIPGCIATLRKYNIKSVKNKSVSSKTKKVSKKKKTDDSDEF